MSIGGLSKARLGRMHDVMAGFVERGEIPGLVTLVSRRDDAGHDAALYVAGHDVVHAAEPRRRQSSGTHRLFPPSCLISGLVGRLGVFCSIASRQR